MNMKLTDIIIKHNDIEMIKSGVVIYKNGTMIPLTEDELKSLLLNFNIHGVGQTIPVEA